MTTQKNKLYKKKMGFRRLCL